MKAEVGKLCPTDQTVLVLGNKVLLEHSHSHSFTYICFVVQRVCHHHAVLPGKRGAAEDLPGAREGWRGHRPWSCTTGERGLTSRLEFLQQHSQENVLCPHLALEGGDG